MPMVFTYDICQISMHREPTILWARKAPLAALILLNMGHVVEAGDSDLGRSDIPSRDQRRWWGRSMISVQRSSVHPWQVDSTG